MEQSVKKFLEDILSAIDEIELFLNPVRNVLMCIRQIYACGVPSNVT